MGLENRLLELLNIEYPVIQGALDAVSTAELVAAVSEAGGLGTLQTGTLDEKELEEEIEKTRELTSKPFAINFPIARKGGRVESLIETAIDKDIDIFTISAGNPKPLLDKLENVEIVMQVIPFSRLASRMEDWGINAIIAEGREAGGAVSATGVSTLPLVTRTVEKVDIPVVAAGGIADKKTATATKALGAEGVQMGTRFLTSRECQLGDKAKNFLLESTGDDVVGIRSGRTKMNVIRNEYVDELLERGETDTIYMEDRFRMADEDNLEQGVLRAGESVNSITEIKSVEEIVREIGKAFLSA
ncbi:enoyl-[acyl-carrier-protein] reductase FabK [archaeon SCG-AAA382B04]|nr:enoyl-[acyl-carrier-protein] reductase FabK [archaeon SCG-AAA382B04]